MNQHFITFDSDIFLKKFQIFPRQDSKVGRQSSSLRATCKQAASNVLLTCQNLLEERLSLRKLLWKRAAGRKCFRIHYHLQNLHWEFESKGMEVENQEKFSLFMSLGCHQFVLFVFSRHTQLINQDKYSIYLYIKHDQILDLLNSRFWKLTLIGMSYESKKNALQCHLGTFFILLSGLPRVSN